MTEQVNQDSVNANVAAVSTCYSTAIGRQLLFKPCNFKYASVSYWHFCLITRTICSHAVLGLGNQ